jgi:hypothetical protein
VDYPNFIEDFSKLLEKATSQVKQNMIKLVSEKNNVFTWLNNHNSHLSKIEKNITD